MKMELPRGKMLRTAVRSAKTRLIQAGLFPGEAFLGNADPNWLRVQGQSFYVPREDLLPLIREVPERNVMVEVGSLVGFSTRLFAQHFERVYSVDPYQPGYDDSHDINSNTFRLTLARDLFTIRFRDDPRVIQYRESSSQACKRFENGSLDFVYIDGDHTYEGVLTDIRNWKDKVRPNGCLAGDDLKWEGVQRAVAELLPTFKTIEGRWLWSNQQ